MVRMNGMVNPCERSRCRHRCPSRCLHNSTWLHSNKCLPNSRCPHLNTYQPSKCHPSNNFLHRNRCLNSSRCLHNSKCPNYKTSPWANQRHHPRPRNPANPRSNNLQPLSPSAARPQQQRAIKPLRPSSASRARNRLRRQWLRARCRICRVGKICSLVTSPHRRSCKMLLQGVWDRVRNSRRRICRDGVCNSRNI